MGDHRYGRTMYWQEKLDEDAEAVRGTAATGCRTLQITWHQQNPCWDLWGRRMDGRERCHGPVALPWAIRGGQSRIHVAALITHGARYVAHGRSRRTESRPQTDEVALALSVCVRYASAWLDVKRCGRQTWLPPRTAAAIKYIAPIMPLCCPLKMPRCTPNHSDRISSSMYDRSFRVCERHICTGIQRCAYKHHHCRIILISFLIANRAG